jgi:hypothetical protein
MSANTTPQTEPKKKLTSTNPILPPKKDDDEVFTEETIMTGAPVEQVIAAEESVASEAKADAPVFTWGNKTFKTNEELADFIADLDKKAAKNQGYQEAIAQLSAKPAVSEVAESKKEEPTGLIIDGKDIGELIWENPGEALRMVTNQAVAQARQVIGAEQVTQKQVDALWENFYSKNRDLDDVREQVDLVLARNQKELYAMPPTEAMDKLATLTRGELNRIRDKFKETEVLGNSPAITAAPTKSGHTAISVPEVVKNVAFIDQVRQLQSKYFTS